MYTNEDYGRLSLNKALTKGDYIGAFEKVNDYLKMIDIGISQINQNVSKINSKQNSTDKINDLIKTTKQNIFDALNYINDIKSFNYTSNIQRNQNINRANNLQREVNIKKDKLQKLIDKIKNKGEEYINNARTSLKIIEEQERESSLSKTLIAPTSLSLLLILSYNSATFFSKT